MVHPDDILESMVTACKQRSVLPHDVTYATVELDSGGRHSNVSPPVIEFKVDDIARDRSRNTEKVDTLTDDDGVETDYVWTQWWDMVVSAKVLSVAGTQYTHRELDQELQQSLYKFDAHGPGRPLPHPDDPNEILHDVNWLVVNSREPANDFGMSPSVRSRDVTFNIGFTHELTSSDLGIEHDNVEDVSIDVDAAFSA